MTESCKTCKFFEPVSPNNKTFVCKRYPPTVLKEDRHTKFPKSFEHQWCGEYQPKEPKIKEGYKLTGKRDIQIEEEDYLDNWAVYC